MKMSRVVPLTVFVSVGVLALAGCSGTPSAGPTAETGGVRVVASTNVYGQIAEAIGGDEVEVTSIINSASQDPHSFEPSARDSLSIKDADLIIENGGGYDPFIDAMIESFGSSAPVITVAEFSDAWPGEEHSHEDGEEHSDENHAEEEGHEDGDHEGHDHIEGFNEHVWYDPHTMEHFAEHLAKELTDLRPDAADAFDTNLQDFLNGISGLETDLDAIAANHEGQSVFATESVPLYLVDAAGLVNVSPEGFTEAVEEGQDVAPAILLESIQLLQTGDVRAVLVNTQTGGAETTRIEEEAAILSIPTVAFSETLPDGSTYLEWMSTNIANLAEALG